MTLFNNIATHFRRKAVENELATVRMQNQLALEKVKSEYIDKATNYGYSNGGASRKKHSMKGWDADSGSPQQDIDLNLDLLRQRSRDSYMSAPIATAAIKSNRTNCIGEGLVLSSKVDYRTLGITKEQAEELEYTIEKEWKLWSESTLCDIKGIHTFMELQQIAFLSWLLNGDCFALPVYAKKEKWYMPYQLRIRLLEGDKISSPGEQGDYIDLYKRNKDNGNRIVNGVEINDEGTVQAYWVCNGYQSEPTVKKWVRIEAFGENTGNPNVLHIFDAERCEQYRGVPFLAPVLEVLKQLTRYQEAEVMAAVINGLFTVFVTTEDGADNVDFSGIDDEYEENEENEEEDHNYKLGNGLVNYLKQGEKIEIADAKRPNTNFDPFVKAFCKYIGAALEIPVELLLLEFTASYSASRGALLQAWKAFRMRRSWFSKDFCQPVFEIWMAEAVSKGRINAPGFFNNPILRKAYCGTTWNGPAAGQLDPVKEATGAKLRIENGLSTRERESIEINGSDFNENVSQLVIEQRKMNEIGGMNNGEN